MSDPVRRCARKQHRCELCERPIRRGWRYVHERITPWDHWENDRYFTYKAHLACDRAWHAVADDWEWYLPGDPVIFREARADWLLDKWRERAVAVGATPDNDSEERT